MPNPFVFANFLETELLEDITAGALTLHIPVAQAAKLPLYASSTQDARLVLWDGTNDPEIVKVTDNPQTGYLTVTRAQESTTSRAWPAGTQVVCALTAELINSALQAYFDHLTVLNANFLKLTGGTLTGALILSGDPTTALQAATKQYADSVIGDKLPLAGGTMLGSINMNGNRVLNLPVPVATTEPVRKNEFDSHITDNANYANNTSGALSTAGTGTAYTVTPSGAAVSTPVDGMTFSARIHTTNDDAPTMAYSSIAAKPIRAVLGQTLPAHFLQAGIPYDFMYDLSSDSWLVRGAFRSVTRVRAGDFKWSAIEVDHDDCLLCDGRALSRTTHAKLFSAIGTKYGSGDGSTTFNIPLQSGRVMVGRDIDSSQYIATNLTTSGGSASATAASITGLAVGMYVYGNANVPAGTTITDINTSTNVLTLSVNATNAGTVSTKFSVFNDPSVTGKTGGSNTRTQHRKEVGQHQHANTVGETAHSHILFNPGNFGGSASGSPGLAGLNVASGSTSTQTATAGVTITNVDSATPQPMIVAQASIIGNLFIYAF